MIHAAGWREIGARPVPYLIDAPPHPWSIWMSNNSISMIHNFKLESVISSRELLVAAKFKTSPKMFCWHRQASQFWRDFTANTQW